MIGILQYGAILNFNPLNTDPIPDRWQRTYVGSSRLRALYGGVTKKRNGNAENDTKKPKIYTANELHYVAVPSQSGAIFLQPSPRRKHPLLLLSGVGTAIGYDLAPESLFAGYMSRQGFDTWILDVRGAGLSTHEVEFGELKLPNNDSTITSVKGKRTERVPMSEQSQSKSQLLETVMQLSERLSGFLNEEGQGPVAPHFFHFQGRLSTSLEDFQKQVDLIVKNDWDFDRYLEEDIPAVMEYIRILSKPKGGKLLAVGHSMRVSC